MREWALEFMREIGFEREATESLISDLDRMLAVPEAEKELCRCVELYVENIDRDYRELLNRADRAAELSGVHRYSAELLLFILLAKHLRECYKEKGIDDHIWFDSMCDLKWKLWECKAVKGIWGTFVGDWFYRFFNMTRFALGRLQFETTTAGDDCIVSGREIKKGMKALAIHIPRTLTPLTKESRIDAYRQAIEFYKEEFGGQPMLFSCHSWLLSEEMPSLLRDGSNVKGFIEDFTIVRYEKANKGEYNDAWRLFDMDYTGNIDDYPEDSSLRRRYKKYLKDGGVMGCGMGYFFADEIK
jgi:hypothetical protein